MNLLIISEEDKPNRYFIDEGLVTAKTYSDTVMNAHLDGRDQHSFITKKVTLGDGSLAYHHFASIRDKRT